MTFKDRLAAAFKTKKSATKLTKVPSRAEVLEVARKRSFTSSRSAFQQEFEKPSADNIDIQTGERRDDTALLHGLAHHESMDSLDSKFNRRWEEETDRLPGEQFIASLPDGLWSYIATYLSPSDAASLAFSSKTLLLRLGQQPWSVLDFPENLKFKTDFLLHMDRYLPNHLLCFSCGLYHRRLHPGEERLKVTRVVNPVVKCPNTGKPGNNTPRKIRIAVGHTLPFSFAQLVMRANLYSPEHGIPLHTLFRRWQDRDSEWMIESSFFIHKGHLLMRVVSRSFASSAMPPSAQRVLLYSPREDYTPYFSTCSHWRDGELMNICKCALSHIPKPVTTIGQQLHTGPQYIRPIRNANPIVSLCSYCRPMRRCPECPTEYLVELKFAEDKNDPLNRFKQAIAVTRWSDLGNCQNSVEWAAINGDVTDFDSFKAIGKRTVSGKFESQSGVAIPGQRLMSLNPKNEKLGEDGDHWY